MYAPVQETAAILGWHKEAVYRWQRKGLVRAKTALWEGRRHAFVCLDDIEKHLLEQQAKLRMPGLRGRGRPSKERVTSMEALRRLDAYRRHLQLRGRA